MTIVSEEMKTLIVSIETGGVDVIDQDVIDEVSNYIPSYNCEAAAEGYFALISSILFFRPSLEHELLKKAIEPLYFFGILDASDIMLWVENYIKKENKYMLPTTYGLMWLENFHTKQNLVNLLLHEIHNENMNE